MLVEGRSTGSHCLSRLYQRKASCYQEIDCLLNTFKQAQESQKIWGNIPGLYPSEDEIIRAINMFADEGSRLSDIIKLFLLTQPGSLVGQLSNRHYHPFITDDIGPEVDVAHINQWKS